LPAGPDRDALQQIRREIDLEFLSEDLINLLKESEDGLQRVKRIVLDLKNFSRVDQAEWQAADLNAGLESTLNVVWNEVKYKARVVRQLAPLPMVECIAAQINQVFMNLIVNAVQAIDKQGTLTLASGQAGEEVWFSVADTGQGMSEEVKRRIFDPFFTTKPVGKGTGLGLSVSFGIVNKHRGRIEVESAPGQGTTFKVWLPIRQTTGDDGVAGAAGGGEGNTALAAPRESQE
jgi:signal transduction histidine kinase